MRRLLLFLPLILAADAAAVSASSCATAAVTSAPDVWDPKQAVTGDVTHDGRADVVFWKREAGAVLLYIAACDGERVTRSWRLRIPLAGDCPPDEAVVELASLLIDPAVVERVCTTGDASECAHLRRENAQRKALADAGAREIRIGTERCGGERVRWSADMGGYMRMPLSRSTMGT